MCAYTLHVFYMYRHGFYKTLEKWRKPSQALIHEQIQVGTLSRVKGGGQTLLLLSSEPVLFARMRNPILKKSLLSLSF